MLVGVGVMKLIAADIVGAAIAGVILLTVADDAAAAAAAAPHHVEVVAVLTHYISLLRDNNDMRWLI